MYKGTSRSLQHAHAVDRPHPSRGYIDAGPDPADVLPDVGTLPIPELRQEQRQLRSEVLQCEQDLAVAKACQNRKAIANIGQRKVVLTSRLSAVNKVLNAKDAPSELASIFKAMREIVGDETTSRIVARSKELRSSPTLPAEIDRLNDRVSA